MMTIQMIMTIMMMALIMNCNGNDDNTGEGSLEVGQVYSFLDGVPLIYWRVVIPDCNEDDDDKDEDEEDSDHADHHDYEDNDQGNEKKMVSRVKDDDYHADHHTMNIKINCLTHQG